jgi:hypothetical protein
MGFSILYDSSGKAGFTIRSEGVTFLVCQRAVVFDKAFKRFPSEVEPVEGRVVPLKARDDAQGLCIVVKTTVVPHEAVKFTLAGMAERRVAKIMRQGQGFGQILVKAKRPGN